MSVNLLDLPPELIIAILSMLSLPSLAACQLTNRALNTLIKESLVLQYVIETQASGVEDCAVSNTCLPARLDKLKAWSHSWLSFGFDRKATISSRITLSGLSWLHDLTDGVFLHSDENACPVNRSNSTCLKYASLASLPTSTGDMQWSTILIGREIIGWAALPREHDMIAFTTMTNLNDGEGPCRIEIVIVHLSTGAHHTAVTEPVIHVTESYQNVNYSKMDISGDMLGIWISRHRFIDDVSYDGLYLYDWKAGMLKVNRESPTRTYGDFLLLSSDIFLLVNVKEWCFELYSCQSSVEGGRRLVKLMLPPLSAGYHAFNLACRNSSPTSPSPAVAQSQQRDKSLRPGDSLPFHVAADNAIAMFKFSISDHTFVFPYLFVTHRQSLLSTLSNPIATQGGNISWQDWGPPVSHWIPSPLDVYRATITIGQRFASIQSISGFDEPSPIRVFDFNPFLVRRLLLNPEGLESPTSVTRIVSGKELLMPALDGDPFAGEVWSELPYVVCSSKETFDYSYIFIDEERIVGMKMDPWGNFLDRIDVLY